MKPDTPLRQSVLRIRPIDPCPDDALTRAYDRLDYRLDRAELVSLRDRITRPESR